MEGYRLLYLLDYLYGVGRIRSGNLNSNAAPHAQQPLSLHHDTCQHAFSEFKLAVGLFLGPWKFHPPLSGRQIVLVTLRKRYPLGILSNRIP